MPFEPSEQFWWERVQHIDQKKCELYPRGKSADAISYFFPPGVVASVTIGYQNPDTQGIHLGYGLVDTDPVDGLVTDGMVPADATPDSTQQDPALYPWGLLGLAHTSDMMRYGIRTVDQTIAPDDDNINGKYYPDWRVGRLDFGTTYDPATNFAAMNSFAIWNILACAYSARFYSIACRLPMEQVKHTGVSGHGYFPALNCYLARVELTSIPSSLDGGAGTPQVWRGGRLTFGHF